MDYSNIKLELAAGKKVRRADWKKGVFIETIDGHITMNKEMWYCNNADANSKSWEIFEEKVKEEKKVQKEEVAEKIVTEKIEKKPKPVKIKLTEVEPEKENQVQIVEEDKESNNE